MSIDAQLYRTLKSGSQFEGLIPAYQGSEYNFDKEADNSNTYDTLRYMAQWSNKYAYQMKRIAPLLKGESIQETVNNIYQFLYSHFQYKLDGSLQNLYSPSAAWHFRKTGFDCKTYSLLASCILQNLNIKHSFRMVQQAGIMPGKWSHVYVIVPDKNIEYVIDATTHTNKQVSYTKKHDYNMKHLGLASPYNSGLLGCACQGTPLGLGASANLENSIGNFHLFLDDLERQGIPKEYTDRMLELIKFNVQNGIDPNMDEIIEKTFSVDIRPTTPTLGQPYYLPHPYSEINYGDTLHGLGGIKFAKFFKKISTNPIVKSITKAVGKIKVFGVSVDSVAQIAKPIINTVKKLIPPKKTFAESFAAPVDPIAQSGDAFINQQPQPQGPLESFGNTFVNQTPTPQVNFQTPQVNFQTPQANYQTAQRTSGYQVPALAPPATATASSNMPLILGGVGALLAVVMLMKK